MFKIFFIIVSVLLIIVILLQQKNSGLGSLMGGGAGDEIAQSRRGADKFLHRATIVLSVLFLGGAIWAMFGF
jgi:preprotein translocase subunit SecG